MVKKELIIKIAENSNVVSAKKDIEAIITAFCDVVTELSVGEKLALKGFGTFERILRPAHTARNPATGESVDVPEKTVLRFKASK